MSGQRFRGPYHIGGLVLAPMDSPHPAIPLPQLHRAEARAITAIAHPIGVTALQQDTVNRLNRPNRFCTMWREIGCLGQTEAVERRT